MAELKSLQKLTNYIVGNKSGTRIGELRELSQLGGVLHIEELQNVADDRDALEANLAGKQFLDDMQLEWNEDDGVEQNGADRVLDNLQPHSNLKRLTIQGYGGLRFPDWLGGPAILFNIVSLRLWSCNNVSAFPPLGQLPCLKHLYIFGLRGIERLGTEFHGTDSSLAKPSFVSLKALSFKDMPRWKKWLCLEGQGVVFPLLKELYIQNCPLLTGDLPTRLPFLTRLEIERCEQLVSPLPRVPAIHELTTRSCDISQWKELPSLLQSLAIKDSDSLEALLEEGKLKMYTRLQDLRIIDCSFSRTLSKVCLPITLKSLVIHQSYNLDFLLLEFFKCRFTFLERLEISYSLCNCLSSFPLKMYPRLNHLGINNVEGLQSLSFAISEGDPTSLHELFICECPNLVSIEFPDLNFSDCSISHCENLKLLLHSAACFQSLTIIGCPELRVPDGVGSVGSGVS